ncbi:MAG: hypothetical protein ACK5Z5_05115 [Neisseriaceae bacterium]|jgi:hypothetical protein
MKKLIKNPINILFTGLIATTITACSAGATTPDVCPYPTFTDATAQSLLTKWGQGLQYYYTNPESSDFYVNAGFFTMSFYTPGATLQPTLSHVQRLGTQSIYDYFTGFLAKHPIMSFNPESNIADALGCGFGGYVGDYDFVTESGTPFESVTKARFTFVYQYMPNTFSESFTVESGNESGTVFKQQNNPNNWYIFFHQSSALPSEN